MKTSDIEPGGRYLVRCKVALGSGPAWTVLKLAQVVDTNGRAVTVEWVEPVCVNLDEYPAGQHAWAMVNNKLRYEQRPVQHQVRATDVLEAAPLPATGSEVAA